MEKRKVAFMAAFLCYLVRFRTDFRPDPGDGFFFDADDARCFFFATAVFFDRLRGTRSGSFAEPVSRFHSSNVAGEISPLTSISANFLRCAWLLNGMSMPP